MNEAKTSRLGEFKADYEANKDAIKAYLETDSTLTHLWGAFFLAKYGPYYGPPDGNKVTSDEYTWLAEKTIKDGFRKKSCTKNYKKKNKNGKRYTIARSQKRSRSIVGMILAAQENFGQGQKFSTRDILPLYIKKMEEQKLMSEIIVDAGEVLTEAVFVSSLNPAAYGGQINKVKSGHFCWSAYAEPRDIEARLAALEAIVAAYIGQRARS